MRRTAAGWVGAVAVLVGAMAAAAAGGVSPADREAIAAAARSRAERARVGIDGVVGDYARVRLIPTPPAVGDPAIAFLRKDASRWAVVLSGTSVDDGALRDLGVPEALRPSWRPTPTANVRDVDFMNFTYRPTGCEGTVLAGPLTVDAGRVSVDPADRDPAAPPDTLSVTAVAYGDLTGDPREEAAVLVGCRENGANFETPEVIVYASAAAGVRVVGSLVEAQMRGDYARSGGVLWGFTRAGVRIRNRRLVVERYADGVHAAPRWVVTLQYRWDRDRFRPAGPPSRTRCCPS
jgi:hypothetical protein